MRSLAVVFIGLALVGCPAADPWDQEVEAGSVTDWVLEEPVQPERVGAGFSSTDDLLERVRERELGVFPGATVSVGFVGQEEDGAVVGYARTVPAPSEHPLRATDLRFEMRLGADGWWIVSMERRFHCAGEVPTTDFCQ